jgi:branched-chain amino acid transport system substrate-binding protein
VQALEKAGTSDLIAVSAALERVSVSFHGQSGAMRAADHQFQQPLVVGVMERQGGPGVKFDVEGSGYGFKVIKQISAAQAEQVTSCKMVRPS